MRKYLVISLVLCGLILAAVMVGPRSGMDLGHRHCYHWIISDAAGVDPSKNVTAPYYPLVSIGAGNIYQSVWETTAFTITEFGLVAQDDLTTAANEDCRFTVTTTSGAIAASQMWVGQANNNTCLSAALDTAGEACHIKNLDSDANALVAAGEVWSIDIHEDGADECDGIQSVVFKLCGEYR